jgi:hypothetical protein
MLNEAAGLARVGPNASVENPDRIDGLKKIVLRST